MFGKVSEYARTIPKGSLVMVQGPVRTREYEKDGIRNRVFALRDETIGKLDRTERQEPATGTEDLDA